MHDASRPPPPGQPARSPGFRDRAFRRPPPMQNLARAVPRAVHPMSFAPAIHKWTARRPPGDIARVLLKTIPYAANAARAARARNYTSSRRSAQQSPSRTFGPLVGGGEGGGRHDPGGLAKLQGPEIFWGRRASSSATRSRTSRATTTSASSARRRLDRPEGHALGRRVHARVAHVGLGVREARAERRVAHCDILSTTSSRARSRTKTSDLGRQKCLGGELFYRRSARKTWLDDAIIGLKSEGPVEVVERARRGRHRTASSRPRARALLEQPHRGASPVAY